MPSAPSSIGEISVKARPRGMLSSTSGATAWMVSSVLLGALSALSLAPYFFTPLLFVAFTGLIYLISRSNTWRGAFVTGWLFGLGQFAVGLSWIAESFNVDAEQFGALAVPAVSGLSAFLALFPAIACAVAKWIGRGGWGLLALFPVCWTLTEFLRGNILTGFPWNLIGYALGVTDETLQAASIVGVYGLSFIAVVFATLPAALVVGRKTRQLPGWLALVTVAAGVFLLWGFGAARLADATIAFVPQTQLRLVQANIPQKSKWDPAERERILARYAQLSSAPAPTRPTHIIWPETALPYLLENNPALVGRLANLVPKGGALVTGAVREVPNDGSETPGLLNSLVSIDEVGAVVAAYDKVRLVPFGEYTPFRDFLPIKKLTAGSTDFVPGAERTVLPVAGLPVAGAIICYEAIFPGTSWQKGRPEWLLNATNDAWFGTSSGPYQHFLAARVRAVEEGLPLARVANSGISAVVDPYGRVMQSLPLDTAGVLDASLPAPIAKGTFYSAVGDLPVIGFCILLLGIGVLRRVYSTAPTSGA